MKAEKEGWLLRGGDSQVNHHSTLHHQKGKWSVRQPNKRRSDTQRLWFHLEKAARVTELKGKGKKTEREMLIM